MRITRKKSGIRVQAIAGSHVVILGMSATKQACKNLLGFAIRRSDLTEGERYWLRGLKTFKEVIPNQKPGMSYPLYEHPVQTFRWADYTAKPDHDYVYEVVPMRGTPKFLSEGAEVKIAVTTESEGDINDNHDVYFNRGVAASQAYSRRFGNKKPSDLPDAKAKEAYKWLSRGLEEALIKFIGRARNSHYALRAAVYEFNHDPVLKAFKQAASNGADVQIIYDARRDHPKESTEKALRKIGIKSMAISRKTGSAISHNKFIVLLRDGRAIAVWTGSTNITESGLYGQSNVGHIVRDSVVARSYLDYWQQLRQDPQYADLRQWNQNHTQDPSGAPAHGTTVIFSPRSDLDVLEWYAERLGRAKRSAHMTAAFGVHDLFEEVLGKHKAHLRYVLLERADEDQAIWTRDRDVRTAIGSYIRGDALFGWLHEKTHFGTHVRYVHDKFMLIDPLSNDPIVITGSANFSAASTRMNDENMLVIRGNTRVADIYVGEFMRLFSHHYFRNLIRKQQGYDISTPRTLYLDSTDKWTRRYFKPHSVKSKERMLFSGASR
jgi:phosphatidylserine/phosphatidylglycerophosphate/cardiolipin synthase-like enzyme